MFDGWGALQIFRMMRGLKWTPILAILALAFADRSIAETAPPGGRAIGGLETIGRAESGSQTNLNSAASSPFPYSVAVEPPREPYRRPVACSTFARETDGSTTCIGIDARGVSGGRTSTKPKPPVASGAQKQVYQQRTRPEPRTVSAARRELTDPRFHQPAPDFVPLQPRSDGFLAFLGGLFSR